MFSPSHLCKEKFDSIEKGHALHRTAWLGIHIKQINFFWGFVFRLKCIWNGSLWQSWGFSFVKCTKRWCLSKMFPFIQYPYALNNNKGKLSIHFRLFFYTHCMPRTMNLPIHILLFFSPIFVRWTGKLTFLLRSWNCSFQMTLNLSNSINRKTNTITENVFI